MIVFGCFLFLLFDVRSVQSFRHSLSYNRPDDGQSASENETAEIFQQQLDHFNPTEVVYWKQRYFVNTEFFTNSSLDRVFFYVGGEGPVSSSQIKSGLCYEAAKRYGGIMFILEHRFYGLSQPFKNLSTANLRYLKIELALADLAYFIEGMNKKYNFPSDVKWILFGGSYAASLAAWMRLKYPHLVRGAAASSAPMLAKVEYPEYLEVVAKDFKEYSTECTNNIKTALAQLDDHFSGKAPENVTAIFNLCPERPATNTSMNMSNLYEHVIDGLAYVAQTSGSNLTLKVACDKMADTSIPKEIHRMGEVIQMVYGNESENCFTATYEEYIGDLNYTGIDENLIMRQWWYQTCTEIGFYQNSNKDNDLFGDRVPVEFFLQMCVDLYGEQYNATYIQSMIDRTNRFTGGLNYQGSNVFFTHGSMDPWYPVGIYEGSNDRYTAVLTKGVAHCAEFMKPEATDSKELRDTRERVLKAVGHWLTEKNNCQALLNDPNSTRNLKPLSHIFIVIFIINLLL